jgi:hypothetical protein
MMKDPKPVPLADFAKVVAQSRAAAEKTRRRYPIYPLAMLDGCTTDAQKLIYVMIGKAIEAGAPIFNAGDHDGCYHMYDGTASDIERKLPPACHGPARVLAEAQKKAASLSDPSSQAWMMRDAFDGLVDVIMRKQERAEPKTR